MSILDQLDKGLVVSCQPVDDGPMDHPEIICAMARAALAGGARGVRIEGVANLDIVRPAMRAPIIGIVKRDIPPYRVRITPYSEDVLALAGAGADIIAYDATLRHRPVACAALVDQIRASGCLAMADCASVADAKQAIEQGADIVGTTLSGYTDDTKPAGSAPDLALVAQFAGLGSFVMAEGRFSTPELAGAAIAAGANCVTVGTPLTRLELNTAAFEAAISAKAGPDA